jgi:hypothetical protein
LPNQRPALYPHSVQLNWTADGFAFATSSHYGRRRTPISRHSGNFAPKRKRPRRLGPLPRLEGGFGGPRRIGAHRSCALCRASSPLPSGSHVPFQVVHRDASLVRRLRRSRNTVRGRPGCRFPGFARRCPA